jgi:hypothetical protein
MHWKMKAREKKKKKEFRTKNLLTGVFLPVFNAKKIAKKLCHGEN